MRATELSRIFRFGLTGLASTLVSYVVFIALMRAGMYYVVSSAASWAGGVLVGFLLNRRFTFGITGRERRVRHFGLYVTGMVLQLLLGLAGYAVTIGRLNLDPTLAFAINLPITTAFSFLFMRYVTFRRPAPVRPSAAERSVD